MDVPCEFPVTPQILTLWKDTVFVYLSDSALMTCILLLLAQSTVIALWSPHTKRKDILQIEGMNLDEKENYSLQ